MSCTGTKRSRNRGTAKCCSADPTSKKNAKKDSARKTKKISKYFSKVTRDENEENSSDLSDSPYKNCLNAVTSAKVDSSSELDDFKTPKAINKVSKIANAKPATKKRKKTIQQPLRKFIEENLKGGDVNPEHLQMALALSESTYQTENPHETPSSQEKMDSFKKALEKYGFGYAKNRAPVEIKKEHQETKKTKKSRFRYVTPILKIRTDEERSALISSKVALILARNNRKPVDKTVYEPPQLFCECLQKYTARKIFRLGHLNLGELNEEGFYVPGLGLEPCHAPCGRLLKDWRKIPGREPTPERESANRNEEIGTELAPPEVEWGEASKDDASFQFGEDNEIQSPYLRGNSFASPSFRVSLEACHAPCGRLLKDWRKIPGRERESANRNEEIEIELAPPEGDTTVEWGEASKANDASFQFGEDNEIKSPYLRGNSFASLSFRVSLEKSFHESQNPGGSPQRSKTQISYDLDNSPPRQSPKRRYECISPDLFGSDDDANSSPILNRLRGGVNLEQIECYDLTHSDEEEETKSLHLTFSDSVNRRLSQDQDEEKSLHLRLSELEGSIDRRLSHDEKETETLHLRLSSDSEDSIGRRLSQDHEKGEDSDSDQEKEKSFNLRISDPEGQRLSRDQEEKSFHLRLSDPEGSIRRLSQDQKSFHLRLSDPEYSIGRRSGLNVTDYVTDLLSNYKEAPPIKKLEKISTSEDESQQSQDSIAISDDELNYSSVFGTPPPEKQVAYDLSDDEFDLPDLELSLSQRIKRKSNSNETPNKNLHQAASSVSPSLEDSFNQVLNEIPPIAASGLVIKTKNVTPMANYDEMDTPKIERELDKFGLKPLKRPKAAKLLRYIYEATHPTVADENGQIVKKRRVEIPKFGGIVGDIGEEGLIFERTQSKKIASCAVPLHIVWHNFVMSNPKIQENILLYEPLQLEVLHSMLKDQGFKFNIQDLLAFLDRKCITVRTVQGQQHGGKKPK